MAQVCQMRDGSGLPGGRELAQGAWLQDIRCGHRRPARLGGSAEDVSGPALPVPPDDDCEALSYRQSRHRGLPGAPLACQQYDQNGQGEFHRRLR